MWQSTTSTGALAGCRVVDLSRVLGGPFCTQILGDHGADVLKLEPPAGDETRQWGPPFEEGLASYFIGVNRNKTGATLDLAQPAGQDFLRTLLADADIMIENFKPGTLEKWGLGYDILKQSFPRLIHCRISGFGGDGPLGGLPGYDACAQAMCGLMSVNGEAGGEPGGAPGAAKAAHSASPYWAVSVRRAASGRGVGEGGRMWACVGRRWEVQELGAGLRGAVVGSGGRRTCLARALREPTRPRRPPPRLPNPFWIELAILPAPSKPPIASTQPPFPPPAPSAGLPSAAAPPRTRPPPPWPPRRPRRRLPGRGVWRGRHPPRPQTRAGHTPGPWQPAGALRAGRCGTCA